MVYYVGATNARNYDAFSLNSKQNTEELLKRYSSTLRGENATLMDHKIYSLLFANYFKDYLQEAIKESEMKVSKEDLQEELRKLISEDREDGGNNEDIAILTNFIADFDALSRGQDFITPDTLSGSIELTA